MRFFTIRTGMQSALLSFAAVLLLGGSFHITRAQSTGTVTGVVMTKDGAPIPGANVGIVNTLIGSTTDIDGQYRL